MPSPGTSPTLSNYTRMSERALRRVAAMTVDTPGGRRRKKAILRAELPRFRELIRCVARDLAEKKRNSA